MNLKDLLKRKPTKTLDRTEFMQLMGRLHLEPQKVLGEDLWRLADPYNHDMVDRQFSFKDIQIRPSESLIEGHYRMGVSGVMLEQGDRGKPIKYGFRYSELIPTA